MPFAAKVGPGRLLLVGWDGADWDVLDPLLQEGRLPHLAELLAEGWRASLRSTIPPVTPPSWTAMATGLLPGRSGVLGFRAFDFRRGSGFAPAMVDSSCLEGRTLFERLAEQGESVGLVGWPMSWPVFPIEGSVVVAGWPRPRTREVPVWPPALSRQLGPWGEMAPALPLGEPSAEQELADSIWWDRRHFEIASKLLRERDDGLVAVVFPGTDHLSHRLWNDPRLAEHFVRVDGWLGGLREAAGPDTATLLVSDHGFRRAATREFHLGRVLESWGLTQHRESTDRGLLNYAGDLAGRGATALREGMPKASWVRVRDRLPGRLRRWGKERANPASTIDVTRSSAFRVALYEQWEGVVCSGLDESERGALAQRIASLKEVRAVYSAAEVFPGAEQGTVPDLVVELDGSFRGGEGLGEGALQETSPEGLHQVLATHRPEGILAGAGPGWTGTAPERPSVADVLVSLLALAGAECPAGLDGRVWTEAIDPTVLAMRPGGAVWEPSNERSGRSGMQPSHSGPLRDQLERLGYL